MGERLAMWKRRRAMKWLDLDPAQLEWLDAWRREHGPRAVAPNIDVGLLLREFPSEFPNRWPSQEAFDLAWNLLVSIRRLAHPHLRRGGALGRCDILRMIEGDVKLVYHQEGDARDG